MSDNEMISEDYDEYGEGNDTLMPSLLSEDEPNEMFNEPSA